MNLTDNFTEAELQVEFAEERIKGCARVLCHEVLEPIRAHFKKPMVITSGYRPEKHNKEVGGKKTSFHLYQDGHCAADFKIPGLPITEVFKWLCLESGLPFDKAIMEHVGDVPHIIHVQIDVNNAPRRLAYVGETGAATTYVKVEVA